MPGFVAALSVLDSAFSRYRKRICGQVVFHIKQIVVTACDPAGHEKGSVQDPNIDAQNCEVLPREKKN